MRQYFALIRKDEASHYGVSFPDLPGCVTAGRTLDEARAFAEEAASLHLAGLAEDRATAPEPSSLEAIMADLQNRDGVALLVPVKDPPARIVWVNITVPEDVLARIDADAERQGINRSSFLAYAATREISAVNDGGPTVPRETTDGRIRPIRRERRRAAPPSRSRNDR